MDACFGHGDCTLLTNFHIYSNLLQVINKGEKKLKGKLITVPPFLFGPRSPLSFLSLFSHSFNQPSRTLYFLKTIIN